MSALVGALGSVIGYLSSEVVEVSLFKRLLWPQRFYNDLTTVNIVKQSFFLTMGGSLHAAALATLDVLRDNGLYLGASRGNLLGTAFLRDTRVKYFWRSRPEQEGSDTPKESRNGFWIEVLSGVKHASENTALPKVDDESNTHILPAMQLVHQLTLRLVADDENVHPEVFRVSEEAYIWKISAGVTCSELSTMAIAVVAGTAFRCWWLVAYMCVPLILKIFAVLFSVRRDGLESKKVLQKNRSVTDMESFELVDPNHGLAVIRGPAPVIQQFSRDYGHPKRDGSSLFLSDRTREVLSMVIIYTFVLYFPAGLIATLWMYTGLQYLWLSYQLYTVLVMHIVRILGWQRCGRTEDRVARLLSQDKEVWLQSTSGHTVAALLNTTGVPSMKAGKVMVQTIIRQ